MFNHVKTNNSIIVNLERKTGRKKKFHISYTKKFQKILGSDLFFVQYVASNFHQYFRECE